MPGQRGRRRKRRERERGGGPVGVGGSVRPLGVGGRKRPTHSGAPRDESSHGNARLCERRTRRRHASASRRADHRSVSQRARSPSRVRRKEAANERRTCSSRRPTHPTRAPSRRGRPAISASARAGWRAARPAGASRRVQSPPCPARGEGAGQPFSLTGAGHPEEIEERTLPGTKRRTPLAKGANLTSTLRRAFALKGALGGVGFGP